MSIHTEWLSLVEASGPFLAVPVLEKVLPQGLETVETPRRKRLREAYEEWREARDTDDPLMDALHRQWVSMVLGELLEFDESVLECHAEGDELKFSYSPQDHEGVFQADCHLNAAVDQPPHLFVSIQAPDTDLESVDKRDGWPASTFERMVALCRTHGVRLGLVTNGERWTLVNAPVGSTSSHVSWYSRLWFQEPLTFKAFQSLLGVRRFYGPEDERLPALLDESLEYNEEVTDTLGEQVRRAVEVLVQSLDRADQDRNRELLKDVSPGELYEAGLTVMMRLVFLLCAEERDLLLLGEPIYDQHYAVSTLRSQLEEEADRHGPEVLERRHDAWARLLSVFRAVYGGVSHETLRLPAMGGSLFDPDRFPFLEGRDAGTSWRESQAIPLPIDNRTVLLLLRALQILEQRGGALLLSYRALDVEQIGHVYEGLLEHTVKRMPDVTLGLQGTKKAKNPNLSLTELERARGEGEEALVALLMDATQKGAPAIVNALQKKVEETLHGKMVAACGGDESLAERLVPFANLVREDAWGDPIVYLKDAFAVTIGADRRETGTHYTPKSLTESIVTTTLEPLVYIGPAEGKPREDWKLKSPQEILDLKVCDPAMGSGAFLVQACRYLGEKLVEAWLNEESTGRSITADGEVVEELGTEEPLTTQLDERLTIARRLVAERCLYGVDVNPLAVELAKLSIWLVTLAKGRPFGFLDHNLRSGDSLLGIHRLDQLTHLSMTPESGQYQFRLFGETIKAAVNEALELRKRLRATPIRDIKDVEAMARLDREARRKLESIELIADAMIGEALRCGGNARELDATLDTLATMAGDFLGGNERMGEQISRQSRGALSTDLPKDHPPRSPFHWAVEFPEVFNKKGFDAAVGNPPFMGGKKISGNMGSAYREYLVKQLASNRKGNADLCAFFLLRFSEIVGRKSFFGIIASSSIAEGETRKVGLDYILNENQTIYSATTSKAWPGKASVTINLLWITTTAWNLDPILDDKRVHNINSYLATNHAIEKPNKLKENKLKSFIGSFVYGQGFVLKPEEAEQLIQQNKRNAEVIFPYLTGDQFLSDPKQDPTVYVINFFDFSLEKAKTYYDCMEIVEKRVKPEREKLKDKGYRKKWWQYGRRAVNLYKEIDGLERVLFHCFTSKYVAFSFVKSDIIFAAPHVVIASDNFSFFALLQSTFHDVWVRQFTSYLGETPRYTPTDCFETFPFPDGLEALSAVGKKYFESRKKELLKRNIGLTDFYNIFHNANDNSQEILSLRELSIEMDNEVALSYGWRDLNLMHGFHETRHGKRFTISSSAREEIIRRLLELNHERHEEEISQGLHGKCNKQISPLAKRVSQNTKTTQAHFSLGVETTANKEAGATPVKAVLGFLGTKNGWHSKAEILAAIDITDGQWNAAIKDLISDGRVERQGERRGARYRATPATRGSV